ncbi:MAG: DUF433 domain-containing protein [Proteobacteria bacterium]|nr:DUF433 domain-containing protein [Pseudomonadota bacterium]
MTGSDEFIRDPAIHHGKLVIRGTRVPVATVVGSLAGGMTFEDIQREYDLTTDQIRAALKVVLRLSAEGLGCSQR